MAWEDNLLEFHELIHWIPQEYGTYLTTHLKYQVVFHQHGQPGTYTVTPTVYAPKQEDLIIRSNKTYNYPFLYASEGLPYVITRIPLFDSPITYLIPKTFSIPWTEKSIVESVPHDYHHYFTSFGTLKGFAYFDMNGNPFNCVPHWDEAIPNFYVQYSATLSADNYYRIEDNVEVEIIRDYLPPSPDEIFEPFDPDTLYCHVALIYTGNNDLQLSDYLSVTEAQQAGYTVSIDYDAFGYKQLIDGVIHRYAKASAYVIGVSDYPLGYYEYIY